MGSVIVAGLLLALVVETLVYRHRAANPRTVAVERLVAGDRVQPRPHVRASPQRRVRAQRRDQRLLQAVVGLVRPDLRAQEARHAGGMALDYLLERRKAHPHIERLGATRRETPGRTNDAAAECISSTPCRSGSELPARIRRHPRLRYQARARTRRARKTERASDRAACSPQPYAPQASR